MKLTKISASCIKTYETCPKKCYTEYILKIRPDANPSARLGKAFHSMFELACKAKTQGKELEKQDPFYYREQAISENKVLEEDLPILDQLTRNCLEWGYMNISDAVGFEKEIKFNLPCGIPVIGYIDRLDIDRNWKADIIDLKTQKNVFTKEELGNNWQAKIYFLGAVNDNPFIDGDVNVNFWIVRHKIQNTKINVMAFDSVLDSLDKKTVEILNSDGQECRPSGLCRFCASPDCKNRSVIKINSFQKKEESSSVKDIKAMLKRIKGQMDKETKTTLQDDDISMF